MKTVIQRVRKASVSVDDKKVSSIEKGLVVFVGIDKKDTETDVIALSQKTVNMRIMSDEDGKFNYSVKDVDGGILVVSQFTLLADTKKGNRPSFFNAADPEKAKMLYELFVETLKTLGIRNVATGEFGSYMHVSLVNDGPVTIVVP